MTDLQKEDFASLIQKYTGPQVSVIDQKVSNLTAPGDNYWSTMLKVDFTVKNEDTGKTEEIHAVAKCAYGLSDPKMIEHLPATFLNEINFYGKILRVLREFQEDHGVKDVLGMFPKMYACRLNMTGELDKANQDAILLLENLKELGYSNVDRHKGFDYQGAQLVLRDLAAFHAVPLALKLKNPKLFEEKVKIYCKMTLLPPPPDDEFAIVEPPETVWLEALEEHESCRQFLPNLRKLMQLDIEKLLNMPAREPFSTLSHNDMWVNNTMQKETGGKLVDNKLLDFQRYFYGSPADDLMFFLFSSVNLQALKDHFDDLLKYYHRYFRSVLESFKCNVIPFNYTNFVEEIKLALQFQLRHTLIMNFVIFGEKGVALTGEPHFKKKREDIPPVALDRLVFIIEELGRRGWI